MRLGINGRFYAARVTGVQRFALEVATRLLDDATLFLPAGVTPPPLPATTRVVVGRLTGHLWEQLELPLLLRRASCDVVLHLAGTAPLIGAGRGVLVIHDVLPLTHPAWFSRAFRVWRTRVLRHAAPRAARIVTVSHWARDEIVRVLGVARESVAVVPQGLAPFDSPAGAEEVSAVRARHRLPDCYLLAVGADPRKNIDFLATVLGRWRERGNQPPPLVLVGEPSRRLFARGRSSWPQGVDVRILGRVSDAELHALYTGASALCFPSLAEGLGRPPLEAAACGTPAVVADYAAAAEIEDAAISVVPLEADAWLNALFPLTKQSRSADRARSVLDQYNWDAAARAVRDVCVAAASDEGRLP